MKGSLKGKLNEIATSHPKHYEDLRQPLEDYMEKRQTKVYKENRNFFQSIALRWRFITGDEKFNEDIRTKAKRIAFLLSQIKADLNENESRKAIICMIDPDSFIVTPIIEELSEEIYEKIDNINIRLNNTEEIIKSLKILDDEFDSLNERIEDEPEISKRSNGYLKKIFKSFLAYEIHLRLEDIQKISISNETEAYKRWKSLKSKVNKIIVQNLDTDSSLDKKPFFGNFLKKMIIQLLKTQNQKKKYYLVELIKTL